MRAHEFILEYNTSDEDDVKVKPKKKYKRKWWNPDANLLDTEWDDDNDADPVDIMNIPDETPSLDDVVNDSQLKQAISKALVTLTAREQRVVSLYYGINTPNHNFREIGEIFDISKMRASQIHNKAMRKLMHPSRSRHLRSFLDYE